MVEKRGRRSSANRESVPFVVPFELPDARPEPPPDLSPRAAQAWRDAVAVMPANHFGPEKWPVLRGYCHHIAAADSIWPRYLAALEAPGTPAKELTKLSRMHSRETDAVRHASRHLGLLVVARNSRRVPRYAVTPTPSPWDL